MRAAQAAIPFEHPKLAVHAEISGNDLAEKLIRAIQASNKVMNSQSRQVIEHEPKQADAVPDHSKPFARFRRL